MKILKQRDFQKGFYKLRDGDEEVEIVDRNGDVVGVFIPKQLVTKRGQLVTKRGVGEQQAVKSGNQAGCKKCKSDPQFIDCDTGEGRCKKHWNEAGQPVSLKIKE